MSIWEEGEWSCAENMTEYFEQRKERAEARHKEFVRRKTIGRANPDSFYHDEYQKSVNRITGLALLILTAVAATVMGGWSTILMAVGFTLAAFLVGMAFTFILLVALPPAWNWLMGE